MRNRRTLPNTAISFQFSHLTLHWTLPPSFPFCSFPFRIYTTSSHHILYSIINPILDIQSTFLWLSYYIWSKTKTLPLVSCSLFCSFFILYKKLQKPVVWSLCFYIPAYPLGKLEIFNQPKVEKAVKFTFKTKLI